MADHVVQTSDRAFDDPFGLIPGGPLLEQGFADAPQKKRPPQRGVALVKQQVAVKRPIVRGKILECQPQHRLGLLHVLKSRRPAR